MRRQGEPAANIDHEAATRVIERYPVRFAVLFGSHARGTQTANSDIDIAVEFEESVPDDTRLRVRARLIADLSIALDTNAVDVADFTSIKPAIGLSALEFGIVLVGSEDRATDLRKRFENRTTPTTHEERMDRFDDVLARMKEFA